MAVDEISTWGKVVRLLWQMCPSDILSLYLILRWLAEEAETDDIVQLLDDIETLNVMKEVAQNKVWRFGEPGFGDQIMAQAKTVLSRNSRQCSFADATTSHLGRALELVHTAPDRNMGMDGLISTFMQDLQPKRTTSSSVDARRVCANPPCSSVESGSIKFPKCSRCKKVAYCSVGCQKPHWKQHKLFCVSYTES